MSATIALEAVSLALRGQPVLDAVSLAVDPGETLALLGPSGSGKTSLLRIVLGFATPISGSVSLNGLVVSRDGQTKPTELALLGAERSKAPNDIVWHKLGMKLMPTAPDSVHRVNGQLQGGMSIIEVSTEGPAARAGIQRGDILIGLHQWETLTLDNVMYVLNHPEANTFAPLKFFVIRGGQVRRGSLQ